MRGLAERRAVEEEDEKKVAEQARSEGKERGLIKGRGEGARLRVGESEGGKGSGGALACLHDEL